MHYITNFYFAYFRVHGLEGLRVIDASIMPDIITGNPGSTIVMIAEKAADMIRGRTLPPIRNK